MQDKASISHLPPSGTRQRIGLFGGSFNPPHSGHLHVAKTALKRIGLDWIWWIPARGNPLKEAPEAFDARVSAIRSIVGDHPKMRVSDIEDRNALTYTIDLFHLLRSHAPNARFVWLMGADSLAGFHQWRHWQEIANALPICVVARPGHGARARFSPFAHRFRRERLPEHAAATLPERDPPAWAFLKAPFDETSSTLLRETGQKG